MSSTPKPPARMRLWRKPDQASATLIAAVIGVIGVIGAALIGGDVINVTAGGAITAGPPPTPTIITPSGPPPTAPTTSPTPDPTPTVKVRRSTGDNPLTLSAGYAADLDTLNAAWDVEYAVSRPRFDLSFHRDVGIRTVGGDIAVVDGPASYETCLNATSYAKGIPQKDVQQGVAACVRTSEKRLAFFTIKKITPRDFPDKIQLDVTVWYPPIEE